MGSEIRGHFPCKAEFFYALPHSKKTTIFCVLPLIPLPASQIRYGSSLFLNYVYNNKSLECPLSSHESKKKYFLIIYGIRQKGLHRRERSVPCGKLQQLWRKLSIDHKCNDLFKTHPVCFPQLPVYCWIDRLCWLEECTLKKPFSWHQAVGYTYGIKYIGHNGQHKNTCFSSPS